MYYLKRNKISHIIHGFGKSIVSAYGKYGDIFLNNDEKS